MTASQPSADARPPSKLAHFVVRTPRYEETVRWYQTVLGARVVFSNPMLTFMTYDDEHHRVAVINVPGIPDARRKPAGIDHIAFTFATLGDLLHTYRRLKQARHHAVLVHQPRPDDVAVLPRSERHPGRAADRQLRHRAKS